jgi:hypothetical protein
VGLKKSIVFNSDSQFTAQALDSGCDLSMMEEIHSVTNKFEKCTVMNKEQNSLHKYDEGNSFLNLKGDTECLSMDTTERSWASDANQVVNDGQQVIIQQR